ncbi:MAG: PLP-dependent aminotransferase family protein, partial [Microbacteriaceae bacterium]
MATLSARALGAQLLGWQDGRALRYVALADRIRLLILDGRIPLSTRLPAERDLAAFLGVSRTTVSSAYAELRETSYLTSIRGSGSLARLPEAPAPAVDSVDAGYLDFSKATMPASSAVVAAARAAVEHLPNYLGDPGFDGVGLPVLREAIAQRYTQRGLTTEPGQIMVTLGAQHAIALVSRTLISRGDRALVESPSYPHAFEALRDAGARLVPVPVSADSGWDVQELERAFSRTNPTFGYLMPDFHNPTGRSMSPELRERVLALAATYGTRIVADETMAELGFDGQPSEAPFAIHGDAVLIGSVGKTLWGGVRVGWIRAERPLIQRLVRARPSGDLGTPLLEQLIVTEVLRDYDTLLESRREVLRAGRDTLERLLAQHFPEWEVPHVVGGLTTWINLGEPVSSALTIAARAQGLNIAAGPRFGVDGAFERFLRFPFSYSEVETTRAVQALAAAWRTLGRHPVPEQPYL